VNLSARSGLLEGRVAIVTGAGRGMGAATARLFATEGASVVVSDIDRSNGAAVAAEIKAAGGSAIFHCTDVSSADEVEALVRSAVETFGALDCAVNNAAVPPDGYEFADLDEASFDRIIAVDLKGVWLCLKYELAYMASAGRGGAIVNIGSTNSFRPQPRSAAYTAAKHGVIGLTKVAALEYGKHRIRVNAVCPGAIMTPMLQEAFDSVPREARPDMSDYVPQMSLLGRLGEPHEVAEASLWLCSDRASYVTGTAHPVDAGYLSR
jgi:NAD(P)-dependent dehydrogenase (short-subunit alcohol dehydrogenase family)